MASGQRDEARVNQFERLKKRADFVAAASGRRFHTERMTVQGRLRDEAVGEGVCGDASVSHEAPGLRIGLTVTKRVGHAPERNRIKRRLREATRAAMNAVDIGELARSEAAGADPAAATGCDDAAGRVRADIVVIARRPVLSAKFDLLVEDFVRALRNVTKPGRPGAGSGGRTKQAGASHPRRGRAKPASHSS
jgi:ribonuclease P protein component